MSLSLPFAQGSDTSKAAAKKSESKAANDRERLFQLLVDAREDGLTTDEAEVYLDLRHQTCSARMNDLHSKLSVVVDSGVRRPTRSGRLATVYVVRQFSARR